MVGESHSIEDFVKKIVFLTQLNKEFRDNEILVLGYIINESLKKSDTLSY